MDLFACSHGLQHSCIPPPPTSLPLQIEDVVTRIQDEKAGGVSIRTVKSFLSKIPSVVSGWCPCCLVRWRPASLEPHISISRAKMTFGAHFHHGLCGWRPMVHSHRARRPGRYTALEKLLLSPLPPRGCRRDDVKALRGAERRDRTPVHGLWMETRP